MSLDTDIAKALDAIHDPCSVAAGRPLSLRQMGLVRGWAVDAGVLRITFVVTFPGCTMAPHFTEAARTALLKLAGIDEVDILIDTTYAWTPADTPAAPAFRGEPLAWRKRVSRAG